jgi:pimeloyl-ACP methyl ester carboxylesterase
MAAPALQPEAAPVQHRVHLDDGRRVLVAEYGRRSPLPLVYLHGILGSRLEPRAGGELGFNIVAPDRPGYGGSVPMPAASLAAFGRDFGRFLDRMEIERCGVVGVSAGGPFAAAAAAMQEQRVRVLVLAAAVADRRTIKEAGGTIRALERLRRPNGVLRALLPRLIRQARHHGLDARFVRRVLREDRPRFAPEIDPAFVYRMLLVSMREGLRPGLGGLLTDVDLLTRRWDFDPRAVEQPTWVFHGAADQVVPPRHAVWWGGHLRRARVTILPGHGHISLLVNQGHPILKVADAAR